MGRLEERLLSEDKRDKALMLTDVVALSILKLEVGDADGHIKVVLDGRFPPLTFSHDV